MKRSTRIQTAKQTVAICEAGSYVLPDGTRVEIAAALAQAQAGTVLYAPENPPQEGRAREARTTRIEVRNETTFQALARLAATEGSHLGCLNFASAKNPGGGFLNGALAQEEALASASGLYPCLLRAREYYDRNRANRSALYLDLAIFSPRVPFFRDDEGALLVRPILASVITAPAPNAGAIAQNEPSNSVHVGPTLRRRAELVLRIGIAQGIDRLVLGAWGCGVFQNDPHEVAQAFAELLLPAGRFDGVFTQVAFAVFDRTADSLNYRAFAEAFS